MYFWQYHVPYFFSSPFFLYFLFYICFFIFIFIFLFICLPSITIFTASAALLKKKFFLLKSIDNRVVARGSRNAPRAIILILKRCGGVDGGGGDGFWGDGDVDDDGSWGNMGAWRDRLRCGLFLVVCRSEGEKRSGRDVERGGEDGICRRQGQRRYFRIDLVTFWMLAILVVKVDGYLSTGTVQYRSFGVVRTGEKRRHCA